MGTSFKDYYRVLSLSRDASESDVKNAYRKLARKHHPDFFSVGMKKAAEERFKEINEAYEVLRDEGKRKIYDRLHVAWEERIAPRSRFSASSVRRRKEDKARSERGPAWNKTEREARTPTETSRGVSFSDFFQSLFGADEEKKEVETKGRGRTPIKPKAGQDIESEMTLTLEEVAEGTKRSIAVQREERCLFCQGRGFMGRQTCARCTGAGVIMEDKDLAVKIPVGIREGDRIRLAGQGEPGMGGGPAGNRYITVRFAEHPQFHWTPDHLEMELSLMPWDAALGTDKKIKTLSGEVILKVPVGTQNGQQFRLRGKGLPIRKGGRQDLYVRVKITIPVSMTSEEREHYMELARLAKKS